MKIAISGSTGLIGRSLVMSLRDDMHTIIRLVRKPTSAPSETNAIHWLPSEGTIQAKKLEGLDAVIHLAGENINGRWNAAKKQRIRESRVTGTQIMAKAIAEAETPPPVFISASAIGIYGSRGDEVLTEDSALGEGFLADVCKEWEAATEPVAKRGVRVVNMRFGVALSPEGGALGKMLPVFRFGAGGQIGSGKQWMSWVAVLDVVRAIEFAMEHAELSGPVNVTAPEPVTNAEFTEAMGSALNRSTVFHVPAFMIKLLYGQMGRETILASERVQPKRLTDAGFHFRYRDVDTALEETLEKE